MFNKSSVMWNKNKYYFLAIFDYVFFSLSNVFMKLASMKNELIDKGIMYALSLFCLFIFSIIWQKLLNHLELNRAYLFKGTTLFWGILFGYYIFNEQVSWNMICGVIIALFGVYIVCRGENSE